MSSPPLSIGIVCFPSLGGSGVIASELAVGLSQRGHRVHLIATAPPIRSLPICDRLSFHEVSMSSYPLFEHAPYALALASAIVDVTTEHALDVLHVHYAVPHAASAHLARQALGPRAPRLVTTLHGTDVTRIGSDPSYRVITRFTVEASDAITVPSEFLKAEAYRLLGIATDTRIDVVPNFVDTDGFAPPARREPARLAELLVAAGMRADGAWGPVLFHASNFRPVKRVGDLLEVLARVRVSVPARLVLVGDGPDRAFAAQRARDLGIAREVCFLGRRVEFVEYLQHADAFVLSSETESFGLAALEALSAGVPVCAYRVGGLPEVVTDAVGRLVAPLDVAALADAVVGVVSDAATREALGTAARAHAVAHFRREPAFEHYERVYRRALAGGR